MKAEFRKDAGTASVERISLQAAKTFVRQWHYSKIFPPHCLVNLGLRNADGERVVSEVTA